jgi:hypothetical protein
MTWIIHRGNRKNIVNANDFHEIQLREDEIVLLKTDDTRCLSYDNAAEAAQAFGYLMEAIKRGERLVNL